MIKVILISTLILITMLLPLIVFILGQQRNWRWGYRLLSLTPMIISIVYLYYLLRTPDSFYHEEYKTITQTEFPKSGVIQYTSSSYKSFQGDYTSAFLIELEPKDIKTLKNNLIQKGFKQTDGTGIIDEHLDYIQSKFGTRSYVDVFTSEPGDTYMVGFLDDHKSVVLYHFVL
jgi:hypothetical protein